MANQVRAEIRMRCSRHNRVQNVLDSLRCNSKAKKRVCRSKNRSWEDLKRQSHTFVNKLIGRSNNKTSQVDPALTRGSKDLKLYEAKQGTVLLKTLCLQKGCIAKRKSRRRTLKKRWPSMRRVQNYTRGQFIELISLICCSRVINKRWWTLEIHYVLNIIR